MSTAKKALLGALLATIIWGATPPVAKFTFTEMPPFIVAFLRFVIATLLFFPVLGFQDKLSKVKFQDYPRLFLLAILGITLSIGLFFIGLNLTSALDAGIIISTGPLFNALAAKIFLHEKVNFAHWLGTILASLGTLVIIVIQPILENTPDATSSILGNLLLLLAVISSTAFNILSKESFKKFAASTIIGFSFLIGAFSFAPLAYFQSKADPNWIRLISFQGLLGLLFLGIFSSLIAYLIYEWSLEKLPIAQTLPMTFLQPVVTIVVAVPLLGEKISTPFITGAAFILLGMFLATIRYPQYHQRSLHHKI